MTTDEFQSQIESDFDEKQIDQLHEEFQLKHNDFMGRDDEVGSQPDIPELTYAEHQAAQEPTEESNIVNSPSHYIWFDIEAIEVIERTLNTSEYLGYLKGCSLKYRLRLGKKDRSLAMQDLAKAEKYEWFYEQFVKNNTERMK